jgi:hypothetical protein
MCEIISTIGDGLISQELYKLCHLLLSHFALRRGGGVGAGASAM